MSGIETRAKLYNKHKPYIKKFKIAMTVAVSIKILIKQCMKNLEEVIRLSSAISASVDADEIEKIESLFELRGKKIEKLTESETELGQRLSGTLGHKDRTAFVQYMRTREKLFRNIQDTDNRMNQTITASKEAVITEMKELYRGRKMNDGYRNTLTFASSFIDTKE